MSSSQNDPEYDLLELLDLLIDLRDDMELLGIKSIQELDERITELERQLGDTDGPV